jgi:hypothetical protein
MTKENAQLLGVFQVEKNCIHTHKSDFFYLYLLLFTPDFKFKSKKFQLSNGFSRKKILH